MTKCVYCIGCAHYKRYEQAWCDQPEKECNNAENWEAKVNGEEGDNGKNQEEI